MKYINIDIALTMKDSVDRYKDLSSSGMFWLNIEKNSGRNIPLANSLNMKKNIAKYLSLIIINILVKITKNDEKDRKLIENLSLSIDFTIMLPNNINRLYEININIKTFVPGYFPNLFFINICQ